MAKIFLCHAHEDKPKVREVYRRLQEEGFQPWLDEEDILPGQLWDEEIRLALRYSDFILIFFSRNSVSKRGYVQREMKLALDAWSEITEGQIYTIPVRLDECEVPVQFQRFQWVELFDERGFDRLVRAIRLGLSQSRRNEASNENPYIYISYVRENEIDVRRLQNELAKYSLRLIDRDKLLPGERWQRFIRNIIREGGFFIACFSVEYNNRHETYMNEEITLAIEELRMRPTDQKWFIPVLLNKSEIPDRSIGMGETLKSLHYVDLYNDWDKGIIRLLSVIQPNTFATDLAVSVGRPTVDRLNLIQALNQLSYSQLQTLIIALDIPRNLIPISSLSQSTQISALLKWAESTGGSGLVRIQEILDTILPAYQQERWTDQIRKSLYETNEINLAEFPEAYRDSIRDQFFKDNSFLNIVFHPYTETLEVSERIRTDRFVNLWSEAEDAVETNIIPKFQKAIDSITEILCEALPFKKLGDYFSIDQFFWPNDRCF